jgi:hypothetical protein
MRQVAARAATQMGLETTTASERESQPQEFNVWMFIYI